MGQYQPQPPVGPGLPKHPQATTVLVLGILGIVMCGVLGPVAWIMGNRTLAEIDANPGQWDGRNDVNLGKVLGIVGTVLLILMVLFLVGVFLLNLLFVGIFFSQVNEIVNEVDFEAILLR